MSEFERLPRASASRYKSGVFRLACVQLAQHWHASKKEWLGDLTTVRPRFLCAANAVGPGIHGSTGGQISDPREPLSSSNFLDSQMRTMLLKRGYTLVLAERRGMAESTGTYAEECAYQAGLRGGTSRSRSRRAGRFAWLDVGCRHLAG